MIRFLPWSTRTETRVTRVSVPAQESSTSHLVPRTVATLYLPDVRNEPLPSPQSLRFLGFLALTRALLRVGHAESCSVGVSVVMPRDCVTLNRPSKKTAVSGFAPALGIAVSVTRPLHVSTLEPTGMPRVTSRST